MTHVGRCPRDLVDRRLGPAPLPLTPAGIEAVAALFKASKYRSFSQYMPIAKELHIGHGYPWDEFLGRMATLCIRSVARGMGPAKQAACFDLVALWRAATAPEAWTTPLAPGGPVDPSRTFCSAPSSCCASWNSAPRCAGTSRV